MMTMMMIMMMMTMIFTHHFLFFFCFNFITIPKNKRKTTITWEKKVTTTFTIKSVKNQLRATRGARNPNLQVVITHASHVYGQHSLGLPLRVSGIHKTPFDHARFDRLPRVSCSRVFDHLSSETYEKQSFGAKAFDFVWTSDRCRPHSVTCGYYWSIICICSVICQEPKKVREFWIYVVLANAEMILT